MPARRPKPRVAAIEADLERTRLELQQEETAQQEARSQLNSLAGERRNLVELAAVQRRSVASQVAQIEGLSASEEVGARRLDPRARARDRSAAPRRRYRGRRRDARAARKLFLAGNRNDHLALRLASQPLRRRAGVSSGPRHRGADGHDRNGGCRRNRYHGTVVRRLRQLHPRSTTAAATRPGTGTFRRFTFRAGSRSSAGKRSARWARPGNRPGRTSTSRCGLRESPSIRPPAFIKTSRVHCAVKKLKGPPSRVLTEKEFMTRFARLLLAAIARRRTCRRRRACHRLPDRPARRPVGPRGRDDWRSARPLRALAAPRTRSS